jgi:cytoskeletal protein RodZ
MIDHDLTQESEISSRITLGQILKKEREKLGLSYEEVAAIIRIRATLLKSLEAGDYTSFSSVTYIKGFIKSYAQFLKIPFEPLFELYEKEPHEKVLSAHLSFADIPKSKKGPSKKIILGASFCLITLILVNVNWKNIKSFVDEHYDIPARLVQNLPKEGEPNVVLKANEEALLQEEPDNIETQPIPIVEQLTPFGDEKIFLIEIPKTNKPILKVDKTTLVPHQNAWIELYNGEELLLRTELKAIQNYLMPKNEATTLLVKGTNEVKIFNTEKEINLEKSLSCDDYHCNLVEVAG